MKRWLIVILLFCHMGAAAGCASTKEKPDADIDVEVDIDVEAEADVEVEVEEDVEEDPAEDIVDVADVDTAEDIITDPDAEDIVDVDAEEDMITDPDVEEEMPDCTTIGALRAMADGPVDEQLCPAIVTYVFYGGYFIQADPSGPAIQVYETSAWLPDVAVGDEVTMRVTSLTSYYGTKEIDGHDPVVILSSDNDILSLVQDLSTGIRPSEDLESELIRVTGATVTDIHGRDVTASYGSATGVAMFLYDSGILCLGATFSVQAIVTEFDVDSIHTIRSYSADDFYDVDTSSCGSGGRAPVPGDLLINEFLADPPSGATGDANCDGTRDAYEDEFIEIVNVSGDLLSLAGVSISDGGYRRHTFWPGTTLASQKTVVVFGGGAPACTVWPSDVWVFVSSCDGLALDNAGDTITIADGLGTTLLAYTYGAEGGSDQSLTLNPDLDDEDASPAGVSGFELHSTADTADGSAFSPGTRIDESPF